ncbi:MAG: hypothetical protein U0360_05745 [Dehalococcoidia bacterium]
MPHPTLAAGETQRGAAVAGYVGPPDVRIRAPIECDERNAGDELGHEDCLGSDTQYQRFAAERAQPFYDLASMVERSAMRPRLDERRRPRLRRKGDLAAWLHRELGAVHTLGLDADPRCWRRYAHRAVEGVSFEAADIRT